MTGMGVNEHQAMHFTGLLEVASWMVEKFDSFDNAYEFMIRKLESGAGDMAIAASVFSLPEPAIRILHSPQQAIQSGLCQRPTYLSRQELNLYRELLGLKR